MPSKLWSRRTFLSATGLLLLPPRLTWAEPKREHDRFVDGRIMYGDFVRGADGAVVDGPSRNGVEIQIDLPASQHIKNFGAPDDGLGLCVFASMTMAARWHHVTELSDVIHKIKQGGGYPEKVTNVIKEFAPAYSDRLVQYEGTDLAVCEKLLSQGRPACVTYGYGERYQMQTIYHMVLLVHLDKDVAVILDNNYTGTFEWMPRAEFQKRFVHPTGKGWAYGLMVPGPPPIPHN